MSRDTLQSTLRNAEHLQATIPTDESAMKQRFNEYRKQLQSYYAARNNDLRGRLSRLRETADAVQRLANELDTATSYLEFLAEELSKMTPLLTAINEVEKLCEEHADDPEGVEMVEDRIRRTLDQVTSEQST